MGSILFTFMLEQQRRDWITQVIKIKNDRVLGVKLNMTRCFQYAIFIDKTANSSVSNVVFVNANAISVFVKIDIFEVGLSNGPPCLSSGEAANHPGLR